MSAVAPNRAVSATVLLTLVVTGGCLAMASGVPVANGRRLQQQPVATSGGQLTSKLLALTSGLEKLKDQLQILLETVVLPSDQQAQLKQFVTSFAQAQGHLQSDVKNLLNHQQLLGQPQVAAVLQDLLTQFAAKLDAVSKQLQNPQPGGGCFQDLQTVSKAAIKAPNKLILRVIGEARARLMLTAVTNTFQSLGGLFDNLFGLGGPCVPGLEVLLSNVQGIVTTIGELVAKIQ